LFWPGYYLLFIATIAAAAAAFSGQRLKVALTVALALQYFDLASLRAAVRHQWQSSSDATPTSDTSWRQLGQAHRHLEVIPAWQCDASPGGDVGYWIFGRLAQQQRMTINSFYAGRYSDAQLEYACREQITQLETLGLQPEAAYVFDGNQTAGLIGLQYNGRYCRRVDGFTLCSFLAGQSGLDPAVLQDLVTLRSGAVVPFAAGNDTADRMLDLNWFQTQASSRTPRGRMARIAFRVPTPTLRPVQIALTITPFSPSPGFEISMSGEPVGSGEPTVSELSLLIPARLIGSDGLVRLQFTLPTAAPLATQMPNRFDPSFGVTQLRVTDAGN
jgi:hypothetical protein